MINRRARPSAWRSTALQDRVISTAFGGCPMWPGLSMTTTRLTVHYDGGGHNLLRLLDHLKSRELNFSRVFSEQPTLNDVFLEITGRQLRD
jgi:hypothetical protein